MNNNILEYLRTIVLTILFAFFVAAGVFAWLINTVTNEENIRQDKQQNVIDYQLIEVLIEKNKQLAEKYRDDFRINLKLGLLYEIKDDYQNAEYQYQQAIDKAPYNEFQPKYDLAKLYILTNRFELASKTMDDISEKPKRKLIGYKADVFFHLGNAYFDKNDYHMALECFRKSLQYYNLLKDDEIIKTINNNIASCLVYIAQDDINKLDIDDAISYLEDAWVLVKAPIIKYNLALLYIYKNPLLANEYFEYVYKKEPRLINFETYYSLLSSLADEAELSGDIQQAKLYRFKMTKIKSFYTSNMLSVNDLKVTDVKTRMAYNRLLKKYKLAFTFRIKNASIYNINSLYVDIIIRNGKEKILTIKEEPVHEAEPLLPTTFTSFMKVETASFKYKKHLPDKLYVDVFVSKQPDNNKILIKTFTVDKESRVKSPIEKLFLKYGLRFF